MGGKLVLLVAACMGRKAPALAATTGGYGKRWCGLREHEGSGCRGWW